MASIIKRPNGAREIRWTDRDGKRPAIRLGKISAKDAGTVRVHIERLIDASIRGIAPPAATSAWVSELGDTFHVKLERAGLVHPREKLDEKTLGEFLEWFTEDRGKTRKPGTLLNWRQAKTSLLGYFGAGKPIRDITEGDAESWREWMLTTPRSDKNPRPLAPNTVRRRCGMARQFFKVAVRKDWIAKNPFEVLEGVSVRGNRSRDYFLLPEDYAKVIDAAPDAQWRVIIALSRYGGLRCPSEHLALRWGDIDWERGRIRVTVPKLEHVEGKGERIIPLFPELREQLEEAWDLLGDEPAEYVITRYRSANQNLRTQFQKIIRRAGLTPWPKLFQNLRASRQTELAAEFPAHVVCHWIGNSEAVAKEHYLRVQDSDFERAIVQAHQNAHQSVPAGACQKPPIVYTENTTVIRDVKTNTSGNLWQCTKYARVDSNHRPAD